MTYQESPPSPRLHGLVATYWGVDSAADSELATHWILPDGCADLICDFVGASPRMRWVGTMTCAIEIQAGGRQDQFGIRFAPGGLFPLLGAPLSLLTDDSAEFAELPAQIWRPPLDGWCEDRDFVARCHRADVSLLAMLPQLRLTDTARQQCRLHAEPALLSSAAVLADEMGMGMRTLQRRFMEHVGVSPRQHLRWLRFERARWLLLQREHRSVDVAMLAGYSDQAHFVREFRRFAGITPGRWC